MIAAMGSLGEIKETFGNIQHRLCLIIYFLVLAMGKFSIKMEHSLHIPYFKRHHQLLNKKCQPKIKVRSSCYKKTFYQPSSTFRDDT
jgi:hypothetical protein